LRRQLPSLGRADFFEDPPSRRLRFGHLALNNTNDDHQDRPAHATAAYVGDDALHVETAATCRRTAHDGLQNRSAHAAADNSSNGIADRPQTLVLQRRACDIATDRTALTASIIRLVMSMVYFSSLLIAAFLN
jgi:hypothetical protein